MHRNVKNSCSWHWSTFEQTSVAYFLKFAQSFKTLSSPNSWLRSSVWMDNVPAAADCIILAIRYRLVEDFLCSPAVQKCNRWCRATVHRSANATRTRTQISSQPRISPLITAPSIYKWSLHRPLLAALELSGGVATVFSPALHHSPLSCIRQWKFSCADWNPGQCAVHTSNNSLYCQVHELMLQALYTLCRVKLLSRAPVQYQSRSLLA